MIHVKIDQQSLTAVSDAPLVAKTVGVTTFDAKFPPDWNGYEKFIVFSGPGGMKSVLYTGRSMPVPWEPLDKPGLLRISAVGLAEGKRDVTSRMTDGLLIFENGDICSDQTASDPTLPPTEQAILLCAKSAKEAQKSEQGAEQALKDAQTVAEKMVEDAEKIIEGVKPDIDRLYTALIRDTITGPVVQGKFVPGTTLDYRIDIEAEQASTGDTGPENVRTISGVKSVDFTVEDEDGNSATYTITLPETSYGGYIDFGCHKYIKTHRVVELDGSENIKSYTSSDEYTMYLGGNYGHDLFGKHYCSHLKVSSAGTKAENAIYLNENKYAWYFNIAKTVEGFKTYLAEQAATGTPVTVVYQLDIPTEYDLANLPVVVSPNGNITVYSHGAGIAVTGYIDTKTYVDNKLALLATSAVGR